MAAEKSKYVYGSVAEAIEVNTGSEVYDPYKENPLLKSKKTARDNAKLKAKIMFNILIIFCICGLTMFRYAQVSQLNYENNKLEKEYDELIKQNELLTISIENARSLNNIREVAENRLQMHKPNKNQIIYVNVPKKDVTLPAKKKESDVILIVKGVENGIKKFLSIF